MFMVIHNYRLLFIATEIVRIMVSKLLESGQGSSLRGGVLEDTGHSMGVLHDELHNTRRGQAIELLDGIFVANLFRNHTVAILVEALVHIKH